MEAASALKPSIYMRRRQELTPCHGIIHNHLYTFIYDREGPPLTSYVIKEFDSELNRFETTAAIYD